MKSFGVMLIFFIVFGLQTSMASNLRDHASWWISNYSVVTGEHDPWAKRTENVFKKVMAASDKRNNRLPRLLILKKEGGPWAVAIPDGTVILTYDALQISYDSVSWEVGDSRIAFVIGHELAHLSKDDFWHSLAFDAVKKFSGNEQDKVAIMGWLSQTSDAKYGSLEAKKTIRTKELQADAYGLISMTIAGFDPHVIVSKGGTNFFEHWVSQVTGMLAYQQDDFHLSPKKRASFLQAYVQPVLQSLSFFKFGTRLFQLGRYEDALLLLRVFQEKFPGHEVFNNLGLSHYQMALEVLERCDPDLAYAFMLSTVLEMETKAKKIARMRGRIGSNRGRHRCLDHKTFQKYIVPAIHSFETARRLNPTHIAAKTNLSAAYILSGDYLKAMSVLDDIFETVPDHHGASNNRAIAEYLFGLSNNINTIDSALKRLKEIPQNHPVYPATLYNRARIQADRKHNAQAQALWESFLTFETKTIYASKVREHLGRTEPRPVAPVSTSFPPIPLGVANTETQAILESMDWVELKAGGTIFEIFKSDEMSILVSDYEVVDLIEVKIKPPMPIELFKQKYGEPSRIVHAYPGETWIYNNYAVDIKNGTVTHWVYFVGNPQ